LENGLKPKVKTKPEAVALVTSNNTPKLALPGDNKQPVLGHVKAILDLNAQLSDELSFSEGDVLDVLSIIDEDFVIARSHSGEVGQIPLAFVEVIDGCVKVSNSIEILTEPKRLSKMEWWKDPSAEEHIARRSSVTMISTEPQPSFEEQTAPIAGDPLYDESVSNDTESAELFGESLVVKEECNINNGIDHARCDIKRVDIRARTLFPFVAENANELTFRENVVLRLIGPIDDQWSEGELNGTRGIFPSSYVEILTSAVIEAVSPSKIRDNLHSGKAAISVNETSLAPTTEFETEKVSDVVSASVGNDLSENANIKHLSTNININSVVDCDKTSGTLDVEKTVDTSHNSSNERVVYYDPLVSVNCIDEVIEKQVANLEECILMQNMVDVNLSSNKVATDIRSSDVIQSQIKTVCAALESIDHFINATILFDAPEAVSGSAENTGVNEENRIPSQVTSASCNDEISVTPVVKEERRIPTQMPDDLNIRSTEGTTELHSPVEVHCQVDDIGLALESNSIQQFAATSKRLSTKPAITRPKPTLKPKPSMNLGVKESICENEITTNIVGNSSVCGHESNHSEENKISVNSKNEKKSEKDDSVCDVSSVNFGSSKIMAVKAGDFENSDVEVLNDLKDANLYPENFKDGISTDFSVPVLDTTELKISNIDHEKSKILPPRPTNRPLFRRQKSLESIEDEETHRSPGALKRANSVKESDDATIAEVNLPVARNVSSPETTKKRMNKSVSFVLPEKNLTISVATSSLSDLKRPGMDSNYQRTKHEIKQAKPARPSTGSNVDGLVIGHSLFYSMKLLDGAGVDYSLAKPECSAMIEATRQSTFYTSFDSDTSVHSQMDPGSGKVSSMELFNNSMNSIDTDGHGRLVPCRPAPPRPGSSRRRLPGTMNSSEEKTGWCINIYDSKIFMNIY